MPRTTSTSLRVDPNVRCLRIYPIQTTSKTVDKLKTIGIKLSQDQAIHLARVLLAMSQEAREIEITGYRFDQRKSDGTYHLTITSMK